MAEETIFQDKDYQKKFDKIKKLLFKSIEEELFDYDGEVAYIKDPKNQMAEDNIDFQRSITVDHIIMDIIDKLKL